MNPMSPNPGTAPWEPEEPAFYGLTPQQVRTSGFAVASLVLGLVGLLTWCTFVPSLLGVTFGAIALGPIRRGESRGRGCALSGIILGIIGLAAGVATVVIIVQSPDSGPIPGAKVSRSQRAALEAMNVVQPAETIELLYAEGLWSVKDGGVVIAGKRLVRYTASGNVDSWPLVEMAGIALTPAATFFDEAQFVVERENGDLMFFGIIGRGGGETFNRVLTQRVAEARREAGKPPPAAEVSAVAAE